MNFRFIDVGDSRMGLSSTNQKDHVASTEFFDQEKQDLRTKALGVMFKQRSGIQALLEFTERGEEDLGEAPNDNPAKLVTKWLMFFPEGKPSVLRLRLKMKGGSECMSQ